MKKSQRNQVGYVDGLDIPIAPMYGIFTYIYHKN